MSKNSDNDKCKDGKCPANGKIGSGHTKGLQYQDKGGKKTDCSGRGKDGFPKK